jgi:hypothetical protein
VSYNNVGPVVLTDSQYLDSSAGAVTAADLDNLVVEFDVEFDTAYDSGYVYLGDITALSPGSDVMIIRMQPDGTNLNFFFTEQNDYATAVVFEPPNTSAQPLALNTVGSVRITHDETRLLSVYLNDVLVDSGIHANVLDMGVERFHLGYGGAGNATFTNINVQSVVTPAIVSHEAVFYLGQGYYAINAEGIPVSTYYGSDIGGEDAVFVGRNDPYLIFQLTDEINALTANDPADDPATLGYEVRIWYGD